MFIGGIGIFGIVYATVNTTQLFPNGIAGYYQSQTHGWSTPAATSKEIYIWDGSCKKITSTTNTLSFIPTKTQGEWDNFVAHLPSGVSVGSCAVNCSYTTYNAGCSAGCGWGNYYTYYTITTPASGGGTCAVTQGQYAGLGGSCYAGSCCAWNMGNSCTTIVGPAYFNEPNPAWNNCSNPTIYYCVNHPIESVYSCVKTGNTYTVYCNNHGTIKCDGSCSYP